MEGVRTEGAGGVGLFERRLPDHLMKEADDRLRRFDGASLIAGGSVGTRHRWQNGREVATKSSMSDLRPFVGNIEQ